MVEICDSVIVLKNTRDLRWAMALLITAWQTSWRRYPSHWVVLVTARSVVLGADGDSYVPHASAPDRARRERW